MANGILLLELRLVVFAAGGPSAPGAHVDSGLSIIVFLP